MKTQVANSFNGTVSAMPNEDATVIPPHPTMNKIAILAKKPFTTVKARSGSSSKLDIRMLACFKLTKGRADDSSLLDLWFVDLNAIRSSSWFRNRVSNFSIGALVSIQVRYAAMSDSRAGRKLFVALLYEANAWSDYASVLGSVRLMDK